MSITRKCNPWVVSWVDSIDGLLFQAVCTFHKWEAPPTANDQLARARAREHKGNGE